jgi:peptidoglycan/xylan/chitin deacetylase (PgdA/CDA1 family)
METWIIGKNLCASCNHCEFSDTPLSAKRWFIMLLCAVLVIAASIAMLNVAIDPFSVFGDALMNWHSYGMTNNPKAAKFSYVDSRVGEFDAFILGPSGASGFCPETLEAYTGLRWYNMFNYGADMEYTERLALHLIETHQPEMLLLTFPIISALTYEMPAADHYYYQPLKPFWRAPFLFANPWHSIDKARLWFSRSYVQQPFDVFIAESGVYNKSRRDAEAIGSMEDYLNVYPEFADMFFRDIDLVFMDENIAAVVSILEAAARFNTEVIIVTAPMLASELERYSYDDVLAFYARLAQVSDGFWDFSFSSISDDVRYFYDTTHFRNSVGEMMLALIFNDDNIYIPDDLGIWVTPENAVETAGKFYNFTPPENINHMREIPVLLYHHLAELDQLVSPALFAEHMDALYNAGFTAIPLSALKDYVFRGVELPERSVVITFDDGYMSNYVYGFPVLSQHGFHATIFSIGVSFGRDTHLTSGRPIFPHFGEREALAMFQSGLISNQSHTFDMHQVEGHDVNPREGILRMEGESESDYIDALRRDHALFVELLRDATGEELIALAYPYGLHDTLSSIVLRNLGISMTFSSNYNYATIVKGLPQSLYEMNRFSIYSDMTGDMLVKTVLG